MYSTEDLRNAWDTAFDGMTIYGEYEDEVREAIKNIADDEMNSAVRALEAIHAEDSEDWNDQAEEVVSDFIGSVVSYAEDLIGNGFDGEIADSAMSRMNTLDHYVDNQSECEEAFFEISSLSEYGSISDVIETAVYAHISQVVRVELQDVIDELPELEDEMKEELTA